MTTALCCGSHYIAGQGDGCNVSKAGYRQIEDVIRVPDMRERMLQDALNDLRRVRAKYEQLTELASVFREIDKVDKKHAASKAA